MEKKKIYCFDIDGTICNNTDGMYAKAEPFADRIEKINSLFEDGHRIVFFTARGMNRFSGDVNLVKEVFYEFTKRQLELWGCKYHELILGKPAYDLLICDKAIKDDIYFDDMVCGKRGKPR